MRTIRLFFLTAVILLSAGVAGAQQMDRDNNGAITRNEWRGNSRSFEVHDHNHDGILTNNEVNMGGGWDSRENHQDRRWNGNYSKNFSRNSGWKRGYSRGQNNFLELDVNNDNILSESEWPANNRTYYQSLDANGDKNVSRDEFFRRRAQQATVAVFSELNVDGDAMISSSEWRGNVADFNRLDLNNDNNISENEFNSISETSVNSGSDTLQNLFAQLFKNQ